MAKDEEIKRQRMELDSMRLQLEQAHGRIVSLEMAARSSNRHSPSKMSLMEKELATRDDDILQLQASLEHKKKEFSELQIRISEMVRTFDSIKSCYPPLPPPPFFLGFWCNFSMSVFLRSGNWIQRRKEISDNKKSSTVRRILSLYVLFHLVLNLGILLFHSALSFAFGFCGFFCHLIFAFALHHCMSMLSRWNIAPFNVK